MGYEGSSMYCGFVAWDNGGTTTTLNNCYTACTLTEGTGLDYCYTFCRTNGTVKLNNCYYLNKVGVAQGTAEPAVRAPCAYVGALRLPTEREEPTL